MADNPYAYQPSRMETVALSSERSVFLTKTYVYLFLAMCGFVACEAFMFMTAPGQQILGSILALPWWALMLGIVGVSFVASWVAQSATSMVAQVGALVAFVIMEAVIFAPLLVYAMMAAGDTSLITSAAGITISAFGLLLTCVVFFTRKDFSFLRGIVTWGLLAGLVTIIFAAILGFQLGVWFSGLMIFVAGAATFYDTSNILHHYPSDQPIAAALSLFASIMLMFYYVLRLLISLQQD